MHRSLNQPRHRRHRRRQLTGKTRHKRRHKRLLRSNPLSRLNNQLKPRSSLRHHRSTLRIHLLSNRQRPSNTNRITGIILRSRCNRTKRLRSSINHRPLTRTMQHIHRRTQPTRNLPIPRSDIQPHLPRLPHSSNIRRRHQRLKLLKRTHPTNREIPHIHTLNLKRRPKRRSTLPIHSRSTIIHPPQRIRPHHIPQLHRLHTKPQIIRQPPSLIIQHPSHLTTRPRRRDQQPIMNNTQLTQPRHTTHIGQGTWQNKTSIKSGQVSPNFRFNFVCERKQITIVHRKLTHDLTPKVLVTNSYKVFIFSHPSSGFAYLRLETCTAVKSPPS